MTDMRKNNYSCMSEHCNELLFWSVCLISAREYYSLLPKYGCKIHKLYILLKKVLHHHISTKIYKCHFFLSIQNLNFKFGTDLEDSIQYLQGLSTGTF